MVINGDKQCGRGVKQQMFAAKTCGKNWRFVGFCVTLQFNRREP